MTTGPQHASWLTLLGSLLALMVWAVVEGRPGPVVALLTAVALVVVAIGDITDRWCWQLTALPFVGLGLAATVWQVWAESLRTPLVVCLLVATEAALARRATGITKEVDAAVKIRTALRRIGDST